MSKKKITMIIVAVLVLLLIAVFAYRTYSNRGYSIVYLATGEVYIGKLTTFPDLQLKDSYVLQVTKDENDPTKNNFQLQALSDALWAPKVLYLTEKNVVFYGPLLPESQIAKKLAEQGK